MSKSIHRWTLVVTDFHGDSMPLFVDVISADNIALPLWFSASGCDDSVSFFARNRDDMAFQLFDCHTTAGGSFEIDDYTIGCAQYSQTDQPGPEDQAGCVRSEARTPDADKETPTRVSVATYIEQSGANYMAARRSDMDALAVLPVDSQVGEACRSLIDHAHAIDRNTADVGPAVDWAKVIRQCRILFTA